MMPRPRGHPQARASAPEGVGFSRLFGSVLRLKVLDVGCRPSQLTGYALALDGYPPLVP